MMSGRGKAHRVVTCRVFVVVTSSVLGCRTVPERSALTYAGDRDGGRIGQAEAPEATGQLTNRRLWVGKYVDFYASDVSPDGRYVTQIDWTTGDLAVRDLATGELQRLTDKGPWSESSDYASGALWAPHGERLVYLWYRAEYSEYEVRILEFDVDDGVPVSSSHRTIYSASNPITIGPLYGWLSDDVMLVTTYRPGTSGALGMLSVSTGAVRVLKSFTWGGVPHADVSPDQRFIAYDHDTSGPTGRDISVLSADGQLERVVVDSPGDDRLLGWVPSDGSLLFHTLQSGTGRVWRLPMADGRPTGPAVPVREDVPVPVPLGFVRDALYYGVPVSAPAFVTATVDFDAHRLVPLPTRFEAPPGGTIVGFRWSPDGQYVVHRIAHPLEGGIYLRRAVGELVGSWQFDIEIMRTEFRWTPGGDAVVVPARDQRDRPGFIKIDLETGGLDMIKRFDPAGSVNRFYTISSDGRLYVTVDGDAEESTNLIALDLATGEERIVRRVVGHGRPTVSNDGRWVALALENRAGDRAIEVSGVDGEGVRTVYRVNRTETGLAPTDSPLSGGEFVPCECVVIGWSEDDRSLIFLDGVQDSANLYRVSREGGEVEWIAEVPDYGSNIVLHPDGRTVAYRTGEWRAEIWALDGLTSPVATDAVGKERSP